MKLVQLPLFFWAARYLSRYKRRRPYTRQLPFGRWIAGYLDQIAIGITQIDRLHLPACSRSWNGPLDDLDANAPQVADNLRERAATDEADVLRPRTRPFGLGLEFVPHLMQVDPAATDLQGAPAIVECDYGDAK